MEEKLNIASILKDKPKGTKLYSPMFGECFLDHITKSNEEIWVKYKNSLHVFDKYGRAYSDGECMLFPSKNMSNWNKFAWKKGDVLTTIDGVVAMFGGWAEEDYTRFNAPYSMEYEDDEVINFHKDNTYPTEDFRKDSEIGKKDSYRKLEEHYDGILNLSTLEIERPKQEFKDGDIVVSEINNKNYGIFLFRCKMRDSNTNEHWYKSYIYIS